MKVKTESVVTLTAAEVSDLLVPAVEERVNAADHLGKFAGGKSKDLGGLAVEVTLQFETEV